ncbi:MAG: ATPase [Leptolyngbyaceae cyanobacterium SM1_3_5]|nr:ATPase [Leptolyngbyaceae cyanobacterium SM1_3_5]
MRLQITSTLGELPTWKTEIEINRPGRALIERFEQESRLPGVILTEKKSLRGMISRRRLFEQISRPYGQELFARRSIEVLYGFLESEVLILSKDISIVEATQTALRRPAHLIYEPLLIELAADSYGVIDFYQLLLACSQIPDLALDCLEEAEQEAQAIEANFIQLQNNYTYHLQMEKMAALGQLVAGVAHEINNPMNFICGNLSHAEDYIQELLEIVDLYESHGSTSKRVQSRLQDFDYEFIKSDLPKLLASLKMGAERIKEIVASLRNFSRLDETEYKAVDIHEGIDSTLMILRSRLKASSQHPEIQVVKDYGDLPRVECHAGQLNQVFMNILANAIDALEERDSDRTESELNEKPSQITICTSAIDQQWVQIAIADNGSGIPPHVQKQIFNPFFTTKPIGKGTGMGLSISYQIITDRHGGKLECLSTLEAGTEFIVQIPIKQRRKSE